MTCFVVTLAFADTKANWKRTTGIGHIMTFRDDTFSPSNSLTIWNSFPFLSTGDPEVVYGLDIDFVDDGPDTLQRFSIQATDVGGRHEAADSLAGVYWIQPHDTDNDEAYYYQNKKTFAIRNSKPIWAECRLMIVEDADSSYSGNFYFGLTDDAPGSGDILGDDGAGAASNYDGICFVKVDTGVAGSTGTTWMSETSNEATQETNLAIATRSDGTYQTLAFLYNGTDVKFYVDGVLSATHITTFPDETMALVLGAKTGAANVDPQFLIDYVKVQSVR